MITYDRSLIEASLDPLVTINAQGMIMDVNEASVKITGVLREELIGTDFSNYFTEPDKARKGYKTAFDKGFVSDFSLTLRHKSGKLTEVSYNASVYKNAKGEVIGVFAAARDMTDHNWVAELKKANKDLAFQFEEKDKRAAELEIANIELEFQNKEKENRAAELVVANTELEYQSGEKEKRAKELIIANEELLFQNKEKENRAAELVLANTELEYQNSEKEKRADELIIANQELIFQNNEKQKRADELIVANHELAFQNNEKVKRANELDIANDELRYQNKEKAKRASELKVANIELDFQNEEKVKIAAELELAHYARSLIEASRDPMFTINTNGQIMDVNDASVHVTGVSREKLIGSDFGKYFTEPEKARNGYKEVFAKGFVSDFPLVIKDHNLTDVLFNGSIYKDEQGRIIGAVVVARDITEQKRIENELIEAKVFAELATLIAENAKAKAESATRVAEDAVKAKQQFLSNMSHEIRTPMNAIIGFTKVILKTEISAKQKEYLSAIKISGDSLIVLINDILDLAKVDAGKMSFEQIPFKLDLSVSAMLHLFNTKVLEKNIVLIKKFDKNIPEVLLGDPVRLHQIIINLVSNAVKFTNQGSITVGVKMIDEDQNKVTIEFSVKDTGIGIPDSKIDKIFENFQQASSGTSRLYGGTGLGLAIVKQLVEPQGGKISVVSEENIGSTFSFYLDFLKTNEKIVADNYIIEEETGLGEIRVLVVEDIPLNQLLMKTLLDDFGFKREIASNGLIAIEKLKEAEFDIVLMDLQMPEMNGFEATDYIRNTMKSDVPIIALTADVTTVDLQKCKAVGMNDYIAKPVDERLLYSKIISLLNRKSSRIKTEIEQVEKKWKYIDLDYLKQRTKSDTKLMLEMITVYLEQTPTLIKAMKESLFTEDWILLHSAVHKMIPSFSIMGMNADFENMAKKVQEFASAHLQNESINDLVLQLEVACNNACSELQEELTRLNKIK